MRSITILTLIATIPTITIHAFSISTTTSATTSSSSIAKLGSTCLQMAPGGWGIGNPLNFQEEEFSSSNRRRRRRRRKDGTGNTSGGDVVGSDEVAYSADTAEKLANLGSIEDPTQFSQRVRMERDNLQLQKKKDLMEIAKIAGLGDRMTPKVNRLVSNDNDASYGEFDINDDDDDLDVRVQWED